MVQTRAAAKRTEPDTAPPQDLSTPSPTKKPRVATRRRRGKPGELCQLNLDVLFLLASYIHPLDLLNLARTCKSLRELLMDKSSTFVWKTARTQAKGLPDCPADLTEPEYANLVFHARCHGCGKYAKKILWSLRRRYCPECRLSKLCSIRDCPDFVRLPVETLALDGVKSSWVDQEQLTTFAGEYERAEDKVKFRKVKEDHNYRVYVHASACRRWEEEKARDRKYDLEVLREERHNSIFDRLKEHGYRPEINYFGYYEIQNCHKPFFRTSRKLTDKDWAAMLPTWVETMKDFRSRRLESAVYLPRTKVLATAYDNYAASRSPDTSVFELLPHLTELSRFAPFQDVIRSPEEVEVGIHSFDPAFEQLPALIDEWKKPLDADLAKLVVIPPGLASDVAGPDVASSSADSVADKLRLACAVFNSYPEVTAHYPEVLSSVRVHSTDVGSESTPSPEGRYGVKLLKDAAYIVHACGLDPNVATVDDMDRRNARLRCMQCARPTVMTWRHAVRHAAHFHRTWCGENVVPPDSNWQCVSDAHVPAIEAAEVAFKTEDTVYRTRCLMCHFRIGNAMYREETLVHVVDRHGVNKDEVRDGVHFKGTKVNSEDWRPVLEMVEEEGTTTFKRPGSG